MIVTANTAYQFSYDNWVKEKEKELNIIDEHINAAIEAGQFCCSIDWIELGRKYFYNESIDDVNIFFVGAARENIGRGAVDIQRKELFTILTYMEYEIKFWNDQYFILNWDRRKLWEG